MAKYVSYVILAMVVFMICQTEASVFEVKKCPKVSPMANVDINKVSQVQVFSLDVHDFK